MSNKIYKMDGSEVEQKMPEQEMPEQKTKNMAIRINVNIAGQGNKCTYMLITGVPEDLPVEYESTVLRTAEGQFAQALNKQLFMEFYNPGKSSKDEQPLFINLSTVSWIEVTGIEKVDTAL